MAERHFKLINSNRFYLPGTKNRWLHLASIHYNTREFMCMADKTTNKIYIEEITNGVGPLFIEDEQLVFDLNEFLKEKNVLNLFKPLLADYEFQI